ncbi:MAG: hypothetical protein Q4G25_01425 [Paracoccus sp. (in: a-proteobacteria)]|nr:hypothetical protein [Paracoccus sp. (in: a-proteobacteria)]
MTNGTEPLPGALQAAIDAAWTVFPWHGPHRRLILCHCNVCVSQQHADLLARTDPRQMPAALLAEYTNSAHGYDEDIEAEFKQLLPRYFELLARLDPPSLDGGYDFTLQRLRDAGYRARWPAPEAAAVDAFFTAWLPHAAQMSAPETGFCASCGQRHRPFTRLVDMISMLVLAEFGADRIIAVADADRSPAMSLHLAIAILTKVRPDGAGHALDGIILSDVPDEARLLGNWLMSPEMGTRLEAAFFATDDPAHQTLLSEAAICCG